MMPPVEFHIFGPDLETLRGLGEQLARSDGPYAGRHPYVGQQSKKTGPTIHSALNEEDAPYGWVK